MTSTGLDTTVIDDAHVHLGARVRLRAPSSQLELRVDTGTVVRPDVWDGYYIVRLDAPAILHHDPDPPAEMLEVVEAADNLEWLGTIVPSSLTVLAFVPCERVERDAAGTILVHPLEGGDASGYPAGMAITLYGRFTGAPGGHAIDLVLVALDTGEEWSLGRAGIVVDDRGEVGDFLYPAMVSFPHPGSYEFQFRTNGRLLAAHPWRALESDEAASS